MFPGECRKKGWVFKSITCILANLLTKNQPVNPHKKVNNRTLVMADKLISLVNCQTYIRYRDIWDLRWLLQQGANPEAGFIRAKIDDYRAVGYLGKLDAMITRLPDIIRDKAFHDQMSRFLPLDVQERTLRKEKFYIFLTNEISHLLDRVKKIASQPGNRRQGTGLITNCPHNH